MITFLAFFFAALSIWLCFEVRDHRALLKANVRYCERVKRGALSEIAAATAFGPESVQLIQRNSELRREAIQYREEAAKWQRDFHLTETVNSALVLENKRLNGLLAGGGKPKQKRKSRAAASGGGGSRRGGASGGGTLRRSK